MFDTTAPPPVRRRSPARELLEANRRLEARVAELIAVQDITRIITGELELNRLFRVCLTAVAEAIEANSIAILLADDDDGSTLRVCARHGRDLRYLVGEHRALGEGIAGWVAQHRVPLLVRSLDEQPSFREAARADGYQAGTFLAVPLETDGRLLGVLGATGKADGLSFGERDLRLLIALGGPIAAALANAQRFETVQRSSVAALCQMVHSLEARHAGFVGHGQRVADYAARAAAELGLDSDDARTLHWAALVHDIGMVVVSDETLARPGVLSPDELAAVQGHPARGEQLLCDLGFLEAARPLIRHHHERWDGGGYPDGLAGRETCPLTRILTLADVFDALTSPRPYRAAWGHEAALAELRARAGTQFDPSFVEPFCRSITATGQEAFRSS